MKKRLHNIYLPKVLCVASTKVEKHCQKNRMSFLQLLAPFCIVQSGGVPVRTPSQSYTVKDFRVKLVSPGYYSPVTPKIAEEEVKLVTKTMRPTTSPETRLIEQQI